MARAMKDSGIKWIGEIPEGWEVSKVSTFFDIQLGKMLQPSQENESDTYESYLCAANLGNNKLKMEPLKQMWFSKEDKEKFGVHCGDLLVVEGGDVASSDIIAEPVHDLYIQNALHRVRSRNGFDLRLLRYYLSIAKASGHIGLICNKATIAHFTKDKFGALAYVVMPLEEQKQIANILDTECAQIDAVIEQTRASIEEYKKLKQAVITEAVTKGIRPGRKMKNSGVEWIDSIPAEWPMERGKGLFIEVDNRSEDGTEELLTVSQYTGITPRSQKNVNMFEAETLEGYKICEVGDIAANTMWLWAGAIGVSEYRGVISPSYNIYRQKNNDFDPTYLDFLLRAAPLVQHYESLSTGIRASRLRLYPQQFLSIRYPVPPLNEQKEIVSFLKEKIDGMDSLIRKKDQYLTEIESYKKSLIFEYVTGKKEVR